jgi:hypothetical protein
LSEADKDIIRLDERTIMDYECVVVVDACPVEYARTYEGFKKTNKLEQRVRGNYEMDLYRR